MECIIEGCNAMTDNSLCSDCQSVNDKASVILERDRVELERQSKTEEIDVICAWCKKRLRTKIVPKGNGEPTHGICEKCYADFMKEC